MQNEQDFTKEQILAIVKEVYEFLIKQGRRSNMKYRNSDGYQHEICAYRGSCGEKCAVGYFIDDETAARWDRYVSEEMAKPYHEGTVGFGYAVTKDRALGIETNFPYALTPKNIEFFMSLQHVHDSMNDVIEDEKDIDRLKENMTELLNEYEVEIPDFLK